MSNIPKSKRKPTQFEASINLIKLRDEITKICINDFGFAYDKVMTNREKYLNQYINTPNYDDIVKRYDKRMESFNNWFIDKEQDVVLQLLRELDKEFTLGNSIYPTDNYVGLLEYAERRKHMDKAIGLCYTLRNEINYILRILPNDKNKYRGVSELIDKQINLIKGVRKADNRFLKQNKFFKQSTE